LFVFPYSNKKGIAFSSFKINSLFIFFGFLIIVFFISVFTGFSTLSLHEINKRLIKSIL